MEMEIIASFCICDDFLKHMKIQDWHNSKMSNTEVMVTHIVSTRFYYGNLERARQCLQSQGYIKQMLSKSQLNRRLHQIPTKVWQGLLEYAYEYRAQLGLSRQFIVDSFPMAVCRNIRIRSCKLFKGRDFRGYNASKKEYFYGLKVTVVTTTEGQPVLTHFCPGKEHDVIPFKQLSLKMLPKGSKVYGDSAYTDYDYEDELLKDGIELVIDRKSNSKRPMTLENYVNLKAHRRRIETAFAKISSWLPKKVHAVTGKGFILKLFGFLASLSMNILFVD
jgi:hypothetical protein